MNRAYVDTPDRQVDYASEGDGPPLVVRFFDARNETSQVI
jgi:hypothetical protein